MEREQWIDDVLNSVDNLNKLSPRESLLQDIRKKALGYNTVDAKTVWAVAATIVLLIALNLRLIVNNDERQVDLMPQGTQTDNPFSDNNQLY